MLLWEFISYESYWVGLRLHSGQPDASRKLISRACVLWTELGQDPSDLGLNLQSAMEAS